MSAVNFILSLARKILARESKGITTIPNQMAAEAKAGEIAATLQSAGLPLNRADEFIKSEQDLVRILNIIESTPPVMKEVPSGIRNTKSADIFELQMPPKKIDPKKGIMGGKQIPDDDLPPPGSRGGDDDIAAPFQSQEETLRNMTEAEIKANLEAQNKATIKKIKERKRPDVYTIDDYDTTNMSDIKKEIIRTETKLGNLNPNSPNFRERAKPLIDKIEALKNKMRDDKAQGGRAGYKVGGIDKARRAFLKTVGTIGAGIGALKTGLLNIGKGADAVKNLPPIKTPVTKLEGTTTQMPDWFPSFINKFRDEGKAKDVFKTKKVEVSKEEYDQAFKEGKGENYGSDVARTPEYKANNPDHMDYYKFEDTDERIYTTYTNDKVPGVRVDDMDGNVDVMFENEYSQPVSLNYTAPGKKGPETGRADLFVQGEAKIEPKSKGEFVANDVEVYATDPDGGFEAVDVIADTVDDMLEGTTRQMEEYATGKKVKGISRGEGRMIEAEVRAEQAADAAAEAAAEAADEFASGGIARMLGE